MITFNHPLDGLSCFLIQWYVSFIPESVPILLKDNLATKLIEHH